MASKLRPSSSAGCSSAASRMHYYCSCWGVVHTGMHPTARQPGSTLHMHTTSVVLLAVKQLTTVQVCFSCHHNSHRALTCGTACIAVCFKCTNQMALKSDAHNNTKAQAHAHQLVTLRLTECRTSVCRHHNLEVICEQNGYTLQIEATS
jgi:hypothetical protein